jgi:hypothetical protein
MKNILRLNGIKYTKTDNKGSLSPLTVHGSSHEVLKDLGGAEITLNYYINAWSCTMLGILHVATFHSAQQARGFRDLTSTYPH